MGKYSRKSKKVLEKKSDIGRSWEAELPFPVSVNSMHCYSVNGVYLSDETRRYYAEVRDILRDTYRQRIFDGRLRAEVILHETDKRRRDINNYTKTLFDSLEGFVYRDDKQIDETILKRGEIKEYAHIKIKITQISDEDERETLKEKVKTDFKNKIKDCKEKAILETCGELMLEKLHTFKLEKKKYKK